jgi:glutaredoxin 3
LGGYREERRGVAKKMEQGCSGEKGDQKMKKRKTVKLYSAPACPGCDAVRQLLQDHGIPYQDINVTTDPHTMKEWMKKSREMEVPVVEVNGDIVIGFDPPRLKEKLGLGT